MYWQLLPRLVDSSFDPPCADANRRLRNTQIEPPTQYARTTTPTTDTTTTSSNQHDSPRSAGSYRYMTRAGEPHMAAAKKVLRYLQSRKKVPLQWCAIDNALPGIIHGYADASFADIPDTRLSSVGYVFLVNGGAILGAPPRHPCNF